MLENNTPTLCSDWTVQHIECLPEGHCLAFTPSNIDLLVELKNKSGDINCNCLSPGMITDVANKHRK